LLGVGYAFISAYLKGEEAKTLSSSQVSDMSKEAGIQDVDLAQVLAQLFAHLEEVEDPDKVCEDCLKHIRRKGLERKIQALEEEIVRARDRRDDERLRVLENQKVDLIMKKARLRMSA